jgi:hypothetical protein
LEQVAQCERLLAAHRWWFSRPDPIGVRLGSSQPRLAAANSYRHAARDPSCIVLFGL